MKIKDIVKDQRTVNFHRYRQGVMYYMFWFDDSAYTFPVPLDDIGDATLWKSHKAITLMRYIRQALKDKTLIKLTS